VLAGLGLGSTERIRGLAVGGGLVIAPEVVGVAAGLFTGFYIDRIDLENFMHVKRVNKRLTGLSIGLVNTTDQLRGLQIGLLNHAANNPRGLRLLPLVNAHF